MAIQLGTTPLSYTATQEERTRAFRVDTRDGMIPKICIDREIKTIKTFEDNSTATTYVPAARLPSAGAYSGGDGTDSSHYPDADGGLHAYFEVSWAEVATKQGSFQIGQSTVRWSDFAEIVAFVLDTLAIDNKEKHKANAIAAAITKRQREIAAEAVAAAEAEAAMQSDPQPEPEPSP